MRKFIFKLPFTRKEELIFIGDEALVREAHDVLSKTKPDGQTSQSPLSRLNVKVNHAIIPASFQPGFVLEKDVVVGVASTPRKGDSVGSVNPLWVVLCNIDKDSEGNIPGDLVKDLCEYGKSVLWLTGMWKLDPDDTTQSTSSQIGGSDTDTANESRNERVASPPSVIGPSSFARAETKNNGDSDMNTYNDANPPTPSKDDRDNSKRSSVSGPAQSSSPFVTPKSSFSRHSSSSRYIGSLDTPYIPKDKLANFEDENMNDGSSSKRTYTNPHISTTQVKHDMAAPPTQHGQDEITRGRDAHSSECENNLTQSSHLARPQHMKPSTWSTTGTRPSSYQAPSIEDISDTCHDPHDKSFVSLSSAVDPTLSSYGENSNYSDNTHTNNYTPVSTSKAMGQNVGYVSTMTPEYMNRANDVSVNALSSSTVEGVAEQPTVWPIKTAVSGSEGPALFSDPEPLLQIANTDITGKGDVPAFPAVEKADACYSNADYELATSNSSKQKAQAANPVSLQVARKQYELKLCNQILKPSLKKGARYFRWSDDKSLQAALEALMKRKEGDLVKRRESLHGASLLGHGPATEVQDSLELSEDDFIIAIMGPRGAGKSTFIRNATGYDKLEIGDDLESRTNDIHVVRIGNSEIYLIDTPGFDDTNRDLDIFKLISEWLEKRFTNQVYLSGLVYLHRISDNRMGGTTLKNFRIFEELCGKDCFHKVTLATTMWDDVDEDVGKERERQLLDDYFAYVVRNGARFERLRNSPESAKELIGEIINDATDLRPLCLQKELVAYNKDLRHTDAGRKMYAELDDVLRSHQAALQQLNRDLRTEISEQVQILLKKEHEELTQELMVLIADMQYMQLGLPTRLRNFMAGFVGKKPLSIGKQEMKFGSTTKRTSAKPLVAQNSPHEIPLIGSNDVLSPLDGTLRQGLIFSEPKERVDNGVQTDLPINGTKMGDRDSDFLTKFYDRRFCCWVREENVELCLILNTHDSVVGPVGSGKTTFVNSATGSSMKVGHDLESCTHMIDVVCIPHDNARIYVVDTPGLNDKDRSDADTCDLISKWFEQCVPEINFAGIVYLHRITDDGVKGKWHENVKFFQQLCSGDYHKVTFATTMWNELGQDVGSTEMHQEERMLKGYFASIFNGGAQLKRVDNAPNSAKFLLTDIIRDSRDLQAVDVQKQLVSGHKDLAEVKISAIMDAKLMRVIGAHKETLVRLSLEKRVEHSEHVQRILQKEYQKLAEELEGVIEKLKARSA